MYTRHGRKVELFQLINTEGGGFLANVPSLPGCLSDGKNAKDALKNVEDAINCWIETAKELGRKIPNKGES